MECINWLLEEEAIYKLKRCTSRLQEWYALDAPKIIIETELKLIKSLCDKLLEKLIKEN